MDLNIFFILLKNCYREQHIDLMWDLESYSTTLNIVRLVKRPPSLMNQYFHFFHFTILLCYHTIMNILPETTTYPEPVLYTLKYNMAYNLSGHPGPMWPKFDIYTHLKHGILKQYQLHLGTLNQDKQCYLHLGTWINNNQSYYIMLTMKHLAISI